MPQIRRLLLALLALALLAAAPARAAGGPSSQSFGTIANCPSQDVKEHCRSTLELTLPGGRRLGGARSFVVREGRVATATVVLSVAARRRLAAGGLRVRVRTVTAIPAGPPTTRQRTLTLTAARAR